MKIPILRCMLEGAEVRRRARAGFSPYRRGPLSSTPSLARHTLDADHVAAVAILLSHRPNLRMSGIIGLWWGFGHTVVLFLAGIAILVLKLRVPEGLSQAAEFGVGLLLVVLGGSLAVTMIQERWHVTCTGTMASTTFTGTVTGKAPRTALPGPRSGSVACRTSCWKSWGRWGPGANLDAILDDLCYPSASRSRGGCCMPP